MINRQNKYILFLKSDRFILFLSIFIASVWWILDNLSKRTSRDFDVKVNFECPIGYIFQNIPPEKISLSLTGEAWKVIRAARAIKSTIFSIPLKALDVQYLSKNDLIYYVNEQTDLSEVNIDVNHEQIPIELVTSKRTKIPLVLTGKIRQSPGLQLVGTYEIIPDSIIVTGPSDLIDTLNEWPLLPRESINKDGTFDIPAVAKPSNSYLLTIPSNEIRIRGEVDSYTQKSIIFNLQKKVKDYEIMPNQIEVTIKVALSYFEQMNQEDLVYDLLPLEPPNYYLEIKSKNPAVYVINYSPRKILKYKKINLTSIQ